MEPPPIDQGFAEYPHGQVNDGQKLLDLLAAYKACNRAGLCFVILILLNVGGRTMTPEYWLIGFVLGLLIFWIGAGFAIKSCAKPLHYNAPLMIGLLVLVTFIPCGALIYLIVLQQQITTKLKAYGIRLASFGGIKKSDLAEAKRRFGI